MFCVAFSSYQLTTVLARGQSAMSWKPADIEAELKAMAMLLQARPDVVGLQERLVKALKTKLQRMSAQSSTDWVLRYDAVKNASLPQGVAAEIQQCLDDLACAGAHQHSATKVTAVAQECKTIQWYLTASDMAALAGCSMWQGCFILTSRMRKLGIKGLKESLKKQCTAILLHFDFERTKKIPSAETIYDVAQHLTDCMQTTLVAIPSKSVALAFYPEDPFLLETSHLHAAYGEERPCKQDFPNLSQLLKKHVWVRTSAAALSHKVLGYQKRFGYSFENPGPLWL